MGMSDKQEHGWKKKQKKTEIFFRLFPLKIVCPA